MVLFGVETRRKSLETLNPEAVIAEKPAYADQR
jgi:hypothetical protein